MNNNMILHRDRFHHDNNKQPTTNNQQPTTNNHNNNNKKKQKKHISYMTKETMTNKITVEKDERDKGQSY